MQLFSFFSQDKKMIEMDQLIDFTLSEDMKELPKRKKCRKHTVALYLFCSFLLWTMYSTVLFYFYCEQPVRLL